MPASPSARARIAARSICAAIPRTMSSWPRFPASSAFSFPSTANRAASGQGLTALWLGPDEWLIVAAPGREKDLAAALRQVLTGQHAAVVDLSEARTVITVTGTRAREMLQKGTPLDLHPRAFEAGHCAQTGLSRANIILHQIDASPRYDVYVQNSFADYLWNWMERAAAEYGLAVRASEAGEA